MKAKNRLMDSLWPIIKLNNNLKPFFILLIFQLFYTIIACQDNNTVIIGSVMDELGHPIPGATIKIVGNDRVTITNKDGKFSLSTTLFVGKVLISCIGFKSQELPFNNLKSQPMNIYLLATSSGLDEVQIIGYGQTTKRLNTGSVASISSKEIGNQPVTNVLQTLSGRMTGVYVETTNGLPGGSVNIQIRGRQSLSAGTAPLYIIDGVPFVSKSLVQNTSLAYGINGAISPFNLINPADIDNITVLKDADATAIYGSRGANGVVLISTKKGSNGKMKFDFNYSQGISKLASFPRLLKLSDYLQIRSEAFAHDGITPSTDPVSGGYAPDLLIWDQNKSTDWSKYMLGGTANSSNLDLSISGGDQNNSFIIGGNYRSEGTVLRGNNHYEKSGFRINSQHSSTNKRFNASISVNYSSDNNKLANPYPSQLANILLLPPNFPLYDQYGNLNWVTGINPLAQLQKTTKSNSENLLVDGILSYKILQDLTIKTSIGLNKLKLKQTIVNPKASQDPTQNPASTTLFGDNSVNSLVIEPQLDYNLNIGSSKLNFLLGSTFQETKTGNQTLTASNFNSESLLENLSSASQLTGTNYSLQYKYISVFGRGTINIKDRYIANFSVRRDGSSRFGPSNRFGNFGALGVAWLFSNEKGLKEHFGWLSYGKLRSSYGIIGNDQISDYQYYSLYASSGFIYQNVPGLAPYSVSNNEFKWESNKKLEFGIELGFLKDRLRIDFNLFRNKSGNQLVSYNLPSSTGFYSFQANLPAVILSKGMELNLTTRNIESKDFSWTTSFNITTSKNILKSFPDLENSAYSNTFFIGESISRATGFLFAGVDPATGDATFLTKQGDKVRVPSFDTFYSTIGDSNPRYYGGLGNAFRYKQFGLEVFFQGVKHSLRGGATIPGSLTNYFEQANNRWQSHNTQTNVPVPTTLTGNNFYYDYSSANFIDASYIRLKNISFSYALPSNWLKKRNINQLRVYLQGQNLMTFWNKNSPFYDPESGASSNIPPLRSFVLGVQFTL